MPQVITSEDRGPAARSTFPLSSASGLDTSPRRTTICYPFTGDTIGGSHISVLGLLNHLDRSRYRIIVVPQYPEGAIARLFAGHEIEFRHGLEWSDFQPGQPFTGRKFFKALRNTLPLARFLRRNRVDIVHTNDGSTHAAWALAARLAGTKLLWHHRGDPGAMGIRLLAPLLADQVLAVSDFALPSSRWWRRATKAQVLRSPFDTGMSIDRTEARRTLLRDAGLPADGIFVAYFGNLIARKRPFLFVEAIARLRQLMPGRPIFGLIFGAAESAAMDDAIQARIHGLGLAEGIRTMGWKSPGPFWIAACDILMVPAVNEPFGRTLIEAMLVGTPVVATRSGGNIEAIRDGETGLLVRPEDAEALAKACARLVLEPDLRNDVAIQAEADAHRRFGEERHCGEVSAIYDRLVPAQAASPKEGR